MKQLKLAALMAIAVSSSVFATSEDGTTTLMLSQPSAQQERILSWATDIHSIAYQELYRSTTSAFEDAELITTAVPSNFVAEDTTAIEGVDYWYWVKVIGTDGKEHLSNVSTTVEDVFASVANSRCKPGAVFKNETVDCQGAKIGSSCKGDSENQKPVITLENATVKNLTLKKDGGADGIHCKKGSCTIQNVVWEDICEDAATLTKTASKLTIIGGAAYNSKNGPGGKPDKVFQHNAKNGSTTTVKGGFTLKGEHGKLWRSCGNCTDNGGPRKLVIDNVKVDATIGSIAGVNSNYGDVAKIRNLKIKNYKSGKPKVCVEYKGVQKGKGESKKIGEKWGSKACDVSKSDVKKL